MKAQTSYGLNIHQGVGCNYVLESDIKKLPFYTTWKKSATGKTCLLLEGDYGIYIHDWENFCKTLNKLELL